MIPILLACFFAGAWGHSLYVINKKSHEITRLRARLWANGVEA